MVDKQTRIIMAIFFVFFFFIHFCPRAGSVNLACMYTQPPSSIVRASNFALYRNAQSF